METVKCSQCDCDIVPSGIGTGYGTDKQGNKTCYSCIGENDRKMLENAQIGEKFCLYLVQDKEVTNWPGSFRAPIFRLTIGNHNIARKRYDFRFKVGNALFSGTQYGDFTQVAHVKRIKL